MFRFYFCFNLMSKSWCLNTYCASLGLLTRLYHTLSPLCKILISCLCILKLQFDIPVSLQIFCFSVINKAKVRFSYTRHQPAKRRVPAARTVKAEQAVTFNRACHDCYWRGNFSESWFIKLAKFVCQEVPESFFNWSSSLSLTSSREHNH